MCAASYKFGAGSRVGGDTSPTWTTGQNYKKDSFQFFSQFFNLEKWKESLWIASFSFFFSRFFNLNSLTMFLNSLFYGVDPAGFIHPCFISSQRCTADSCFSWNNLKALLKAFLSIISPIAFLKHQNIMLWAIHFFKVWVCLWMNISSICSYRNNLHVSVISAFQL